MSFPINYSIEPKSNLSVNHIIYNQNLVLIISISSVVFLWIPLLGCLICSILVFISNCRKGVIPNLVLLWSFVCIIQSQRQLQPVVDELGDWGRYGDFYENCKYIDFILTDEGSKDIAFSFWNYICHFIFRSNYIAFADFTVDIELLLFSLANYKIWEKSQTDARTGICAICMILLFSEIILISNNLLRQMFATSIMIYGLIDKNTSNSYRWLAFVIIGFLIHSMTIVFIPLYFLRIGAPPSKKIFITGLSLILTIPLLFVILKNKLISSSFYILQRIGNADEYLSTDIIDPIVIYIFAFVIFIFYFKHFFSDKNVSQYIWIGSNTILYITLICILTASMPLLVTRVYIDRLPLLSMVIPYFFTKKSIYNSSYLLLIIVFYYFRFAFLSNGGYLDISKYAIMPFYELL